MCGITGIFDLEARRDIDKSLLEVMNRSQAHRGPDGEGYHLEPGVGLGHRRLSIIDIEGGHQPLFNEDGSVDIYFGKIAPEGLESNWIPTAGEDFFLLFRFYGPEAPYFDKSFKLPNLEKLAQ